jgi:hypothetical protein
VLFLSGGHFIAEDVNATSAASGFGPLASALAFRLGMTTTGSIL